MFHLFNKVYIASDSIINLNYDRIVISEKNGNLMDEPLDKVTHGTLLGYGKSVEEVLRNEGFSNFINGLNNKVNNNNKKIVIYVDEDNFCKFMSLWFKSIFKNPSSTDCWKIIECYLSKEKIIKNTEYLFSPYEFRDFPFIEKERFNSYFSQVGSNILTNIKPLLSFEILLASYLNDGLNKSELKSSLFNILKRTMEELILDIKRSYFKNYRKSSFPNLNVDYNFFVNSSLYVGEPLRLAGGSSLVNIIGANENDIEIFKNFAKRILTEWEEFREDSSFLKRIEFIDIIRKGISDEDLNTLIQFEKQSKNDIRLYATVDEEKINYYFLDFVLNCNSSDLYSYALK